MKELLHPWWGALFFFIGVAAVAGAFATLFMTMGRRPRRFSLENPFPVGSKRFLEGVSGLLNVPLQSGGTARLLNNGDEIFPAILEALRGAERSINFMTYIWERGRISDEVLAVLRERAAAVRRPGVSAPSLPFPRPGGAVPPPVRGRR